MNHKAIRTSIGLLIIALIVGGVIYLQWPKRLGEVPHPSSQPTSTATSSLLKSTPTLVLGPLLAEAAPTITWTPTSITRSILAGQSVQVPVSFISSENLSSVVVSVVPELQPYVKTTPTSFANITKGQTVNLDITVSASSTVLPQIVDGVIQLRSGQGAPQTFAQPLPVTVKVLWQSFNDPRVPNITFQYPTFGQPSRVDVKPSDEGITLIDINILSETDNTYISQFGFSIINNSEHLSLEQWFRQNVDPDGTLLSTRAFVSQTLSNRMNILASVGPVPDTYADQFGPVSLFYAISPSGNTIIGATLSQVNELDFQGFTTPDSQVALLRTILESIQFR